MTNEIAAQRNVQQGEIILYQPDENTPCFSITKPCGSCFCSVQLIAAMATAATANAPKR